MEDNRRNYSKKIVTGLWDCEYCGTKHIPGNQKTCPNCGRPAGENVKYYIGDPSTRIEIHNPTDDDKQANWKCDYCGAYNKFSSNSCRTCGAPKDGTKDYFENHRERDNSIQLGQNNNTGYQGQNNNTGYQGQNNSLNPMDNYQEDGEKHTLLYFLKTHKRLVTILSILLVLSIFAFNIFAPKSNTVKINSKEWNRVIYTEHYITVNESDWNVPTGGRVINSKSEIHHYDQILDHYEDVEVRKSREVISGYDQKERTVDLGNGNFEVETWEEPIYTTEYYYETERQPVYVNVPRYQTKYYYEIERWVKFRNLESNGVNDEPYWSNEKLESNERESSRKEEYKIYYQFNKSEKVYEINLDQYNKYNVGDILNVKANKIGITEILD